jgi:hypothetical protein
MQPLIFCSQYAIAHPTAGRNKLMDFHVCFKWRYRHAEKGKIPNLHRREIILYIEGNSAIALQLVLVAVMRADIP